MATFTTSPDHLKLRYVGLIFIILAQMLPSKMIKITKILN